MRKGISSLVLACLALLFLAPPGQGGEQPSRAGFRGYIDGHSHLFARFGPPEGVEEEDYAGAVAGALAAMDRLGITLTVLMPPPFTPGQPHSYDHEDLAPVARDHPRRFVFLAGGGSLNPMIQEALAQGAVSPGLKKRFVTAAQDILAAGALGFGEMAALHFSFRPGHPFMAVPPDHELFLLLADIAAKHGVPIDLHMEAVPQDMELPAHLSSPPNPAHLKANIPALERLLAHNREAKIIWSHVGWGHTGQRTPALCRRLLAKHPNLYMSFKLHRHSHPAVRVLRRRPAPGVDPAWLALIREYHNRFFIGADMFYTSPQSHQEFPQSARGPKALLSLLPMDLAVKLGRETPRRLFKLQP